MDKGIGPSLLILQFRYFYLFTLYVIRKSFQISISFFLGESCPRRPTITMLHCFKLIIKHNINIHKTSHSQNNTRTSWRMLWTHIGRQNHSTSMCSDGHSMTKVQNKRAVLPSSDKFNTVTAGVYNQSSLQVNDWVILKCSSTVL